VSPSWAYGLSAWIAQRAAKLAPEVMCHRLEEEWAADLSALDGPVLQLRFALGCCRAALAMRGDRFDAPLPKTVSRKTVEGIPSARPRAGVTFPFARRRERIREEAFTWLERLRRGLRDEQGSELRDWLRRRSHRACIARVAAQRDRPEDLVVLSQIFEVNPAWVEPRQGRSPTINAAAALMAICIAALPLFYTHYSTPGLILGPALEGSFMEASGIVYTSGQRALRRVGLPDGTRVVMNRGTRIAVLYSDQSRSVLLVRGEATFTVPRQAFQPFDLTVGDRHFRTMASTFNVRLTSKDAIELAVLEGVVAVRAAPAIATVHAAAPGEGDAKLPVPTLLKARQMIDTGPGPDSARTLSQLEALARIAWQRG
jgi:ferric-dicitrate binding protein FerR (iron transport regulator)